ncbi:MAG: preprotein translocase subunit SecG [Bacteroidales bacterium]|jgi:preprotein translocase subunit SecG|nr:preprotein translocase subunit SecG [Bacteroidales bacterium]
MQAAYITLSIIIVIASILLTIVVLLQNSKGGGLAANFATGNQTFGVRQTADFLEKATWTLAAVVIVLSVVATFVIPQRSSRHSNIKNQIEQTVPVEGAPEIPVTPAEPAPEGE